jgi:hypothetical protein
MRNPLQMNEMFYSDYRRKGSLFVLRNALIHAEAIANLLILSDYEYNSTCCAPTFCSNLFKQHVFLNVFDTSSLLEINFYLFFFDHTPFI